MSQSSEPPKVRFADPKRTLKPAEIDFMKLIEKQNVERVLKLKKTRKNNLVTAAALGASVLAIYGYSLFAVKQEKFLDDFEEPVKVK